MAALMLIVHYYNSIHLRTELFVALYSINCWWLLAHPSSGKTTIPLKLLCGRQRSLMSSQWRIQAELILYPFPELIPWQQATGKCIKIDYLSCRQVWWC